MAYGSSDVCYVVPTNLHNYIYLHYCVVCNILNRWLQLIVIVDLYKVRDHIDYEDVLTNVLAPKGFTIPYIALYKST